MYTILFISYILKLPTYIYKYVQRFWLMINSIKLSLNMVFPSYSNTPRWITSTLQALSTGRQPKVGSG